MKDLQEDFNRRGGPEDVRRIWMTLGESLKISSGYSEPVAPLKSYVRHFPWTFSYPLVIMPLSS